MAKQIVVQHNGKTSSFDFFKVDRSKLYGKRRRLHLDPEEKTCTRAQLTRDGSLLLQSGMLAQGYFKSTGEWIPQRELMGVDGAGRAVEKVPSTLGEDQALEGPVPTEELLDLHVLTVYALDAADVDAGLTKSLMQGDVYRFKFNYRADYHAEIGYLLANKEGVYCLVGSPTILQWCELGQIVSESFEEEEVEDELDFEMF